MQSTQAKWRVVIADAPHREDLFAEMWIGSEQLGEVFIEAGEAYVEFYPHSSEKLWRFEYAILVSMIDETVKFLTSVNYQVKTH
jgi:hypothetical protein